MIFLNFGEKSKIFLVLCRWQGENIMFFTNRTDLALEFTKKETDQSRVRHEEYKIYGMQIPETMLTAEGARLLEKPCGRYFTVYSEKVPDVKREIYALSAVFRKILPTGKCLVVGLGNPSIAADSLGWKTAGSILATSQYVKEGLSRGGIGDVSVIRTNVSSNSGIDSTYQAAMSANGIDADYIIAIDSLACNSAGRLCRTVQVTDTGICPGSGAGNPRQRLDMLSCGVPVIAVGVPTAMEYSTAGEKYYVTKRDIDIDVRRYAHVISAAINRTLSPALSEEDCRMLMHYC